jgi:hypothetical protein
LFANFFLFNSPPSLFFFLLTFQNSPSGLIFFFFNWI